VNTARAAQSSGTDAGSAGPVLLAHDWLTGVRGGERVLEDLSRAFPEAPIFTLVHRAGSTTPWLESRTIRTSFIQRLPRAAAWYRYSLPLMPLAVESMRLPPARLLISTSHCAIKGIRPAAGTPHLCYCFTPMRYAWGFYREYFGRSLARRVLLGPLLAYLRAWDRARASRVDRFVAISQTVARRIRQHYGRDCSVVYPGVDIDYFTPDEPDRPDNYHLIVSALAPYKNLKLAIRAFNRLGQRLLIVGTGTEAEQLRRIAGPTIEFCGRRTDDEVRELYRRCRALVFPGIEDFGLTPVEVQACGRPVIAFDRGGVTESVSHGTTGILFEEPTVACLVAAIQEAERVRWEPAVIRASVTRFSRPRFRAEFSRQMQELAPGLQLPEAEAR